MGRALMVQGTASHVGKSVLVAGLCRLFLQAGLRVAPFKAQNMALNSFATRDGREIGRAQAVQAIAAGVVPTVDMNPILLKPEGNARSQVVVAGRVFGVMDAATYHARKEEFWPEVEASLHRLLAAYDLVIIEGAGSPVEVNLKDSDLVNMRVALAVQAPVLLVADIDRGGVFASLVGTMALLEAAERDLVAGIIVNKFRGDPELFRPGVTFLEQRLERRVLGVVPWMDDLGIAEEDSQGLLAAQPHWDHGDHVAADAALLDIAILRLPHVANFDDFDPLARRPGVRIRYCARPEDIGTPDLIVLPGTKTTRADLADLRARGLDSAVLAHAKQGGAVLGICGGYQMLGEWIEDADGVEGPAGAVPGLGLLPAVTHFDAQKATMQVQATVRAAAGLFSAAGGTPFEAYEIHMGRTVSPGSAPFAVFDGAGIERPEGAQSADGRIVGTYLHGLLQNPAVLEGLLGALADRRGVQLPAPLLAFDPYDRFAQHLRDSLDLDILYGLVELRP